tara:strand:- start:255 stop:512 length:258 start_codon:yes stop_codon:yes gene_type:complete
MSVFKEETIKSILEKAQADKTGEVASVIRELMEITKKAGYLGFTLEELSVIGTTGWYVSKDPRMAEIMKNMMSVPPPPPDDEFIN